MFISLIRFFCFKSRVLIKRVYVMTCYIEELENSLEDTKTECESYVMIALLLFYLSLFQAEATLVIEFYSCIKITQGDKSTLESLSCMWAKRKRKPPTASQRRLCAKACWFKEQGPWRRGGMPSKSKAWHQQIQHAANGEGIISTQKERNEDNKDIMTPTETT